MVRILVWNINALAPTVKNFVLKHGSLGGFFESHQADIVCFQETKLIDEKLTKEMACVDGFESFWAFSRTKKGYSGVATYCRTGWSPVAVELDSLGTLDTELNGEGRAILSDHGSFVLVNVYVPNAGKRGEEMSDRASLKVRFLHALKARCDQLVEEGRQVIMVGDFNIAATPKDVNSTLDWSRMYHAEELEIMRALLRDYTDVWRVQHPDVTDQFTVWDEKTSARAFNQGVRIDYVLVSPGLLPNVGPCEILDTPPKWSDHAAMLADINALDPQPPHEPLAESSRRMKKFDTRSQPSIKSMFARQRPAPSSRDAPAPEKRVREDTQPAAAAAAEGCFGASKKARGDPNQGSIGDAEIGDGAPGADQLRAVDPEEGNAAPGSLSESRVVIDELDGQAREGQSEQTNTKITTEGKNSKLASSQSNAGPSKAQPGIASFFQKRPKK